MSRSVSALGIRKDSKSAVLKASELLRMKGLTHTCVEKGKDGDGSALGLTGSLSRKEKIKKIDSLRHGQSRVATAVEKEELSKQEDLLLHAKDQLAEQHDAVKRMNKHTLFAKCATIRDGQLEEKKLIAKERAEEEKRKDLMMELERRKALRMYEEREERRHEEKKKGAAVVLEQIAERAKERERQVELKNLEQKAMLDQIEKLKREEEDEARRKKETVRRFQDEILEANLDQLRAKRMQKETEKQEELRIAAYVKEKEDREGVLAAEAERVAAEREMEVARLRSLQERAQDKQAEVDSLRARRAQESVEMAKRQKESEAAEKRKKMERDVAISRTAQLAEKQRRTARETAEDEVEYSSLVAAQKEDVEEVRKSAEEAKLRRKTHAEAVHAQIEEMVHDDRKTRTMASEEAKKLVAAEEAELEKLEQIRQRKSHELESSGVPSKYHRDLIGMPLKSSKVST